MVTLTHRVSLNYGSGDAGVTLQVRLPVRRCRECEFEFVDREGKSLLHEALCRHPGVLEPAEVRAIRKQYGMSGAAFAVVTGLGEADLARWERGVVIQTRANDLYLRLLPDPRNRYSPQPPAPRPR